MPSKTANNLLICLSSPLLWLQVRSLIHSLLVRIGRHHPQALMYPLLVAAKSQSPSRRQAAYAVLDVVRTHSATLVEQAQVRWQDKVSSVRCDMHQVTAVCWMWCAHTAQHWWSRHSCDGWLHETWCKHLPTFTVQTQEAILSVSLS
jgi:hypothetical protein